MKYSEFDEDELEELDEEFDDELDETEDAEEAVDESKGARDWSERGMAEKAVFDQFEAVFGKNLAVFYCCVRFDIPFETNCVPKKPVDNAWALYKRRLRKRKEYLGENFGGKGFLDGMADITKIFGADLTLKDFSRAVDAEVAARVRRNGTNKQRADWGTNGTKNPYTNYDYQELDRTYAIFCSRKKGVGLDEQQEYTLRECAKMDLAMQKAMQAGDVQTAAKYHAMIQKSLESESMRKKDEKPVDDLRIDGITDALEKKYGIDPNKMLSKEAVLKVIYEWMRSKKYPETLDCAHKITLSIINATRINNDEPPLLDLPEELEFTDDYGELAKEPNEAEQAAYEYLGLIRGNGKASPPTEENDKGEIDDG